MQQPLLQQQQQQQQQQPPPPPPPPLLPGDGDVLDPALLIEALTDAAANVLASIYVAVRATTEVCRSPVVIGTVKRTSKTVVLTALVHYALLSVILWPLSLAARLLRLLSLSLVRLDVALIHGSMCVYPLLTLLLIKYVYRSSLDDCFRLTLAQLDPAAAAALASAPRRCRPSLTQRLLGRFGVAGDGNGDDLTTALLLMLVGVLLRAWRRLPYVGWLVAPLLQYGSIRYMVGHPGAAVACLLAAALVPPLERPVMNFVELWSSARVFGRSVGLRYFLNRKLPHQQRAGFVRLHETTVVTYMLLPTALARLPLVGSLVAFPAAALGAHALADILARNKGLEAVLAEAGGDDGGE